MIQIVLSDIPQPCRVGLRMKRNVCQLRTLVCMDFELSIVLSIDEFDLYILFWRVGSFARYKSVYLQFNPFGNDIHVMRLAASGA